LFSGFASALQIGTSRAGCLWPASSCQASATTPHLKNLPSAWYRTFCVCRTSFERDTPFSASCFGEPSHLCLQSLQTDTTSPATILLATFVRHNSPAESRPATHLTPPSPGPLSQLQRPGCTLLHADGPLKKPGIPRLAPLSVAYLRVRTQSAFSSQRTSSF